MVLNFKFFFYGWASLQKDALQIGEVWEISQGEGEKYFAIMRLMRYNRVKIYELPKEFHNEILPVFVR